VSASASSARHTSTRAALDPDARCRALGSTRCASIDARGRSRAHATGTRRRGTVRDAARDRIDDRAPVSGVCVDVGVGWRAGER